MTVFQSVTTINKPVEVVYSFLSDLNNHEKLMPENIYNWTSTVDEARFTVKNMAKLALKVSQRTENKEIVCIPVEEPPFAIKLSWKIEANADIAAKAIFTIEADLNMMMKMLASGPLQKLADFQTGKLQEILA